MPENKQEITRLVQSSRTGDACAERVLLPRIYRELQRLASYMRSRERVDLTLSTKGLVHEAYIKLVDSSKVTWRDEQHFVALASRALRQVLIDYARARNRQKRRGKAVHLSLSEMDIAGIEQDEDILRLNEALESLMRYDASLAALVELRWFGGMTVRDAAAVLGTSVRTTERNWTRAKAFLLAELTGTFDN